jgi:hypothetical protein
MSVHETSARLPEQFRLTAVQRLWVPVWARCQRWSLTRRCIMCRGLVGVPAPGESPQYCSAACRDQHYAC